VELWLLLLLLLLDEAQQQQDTSRSVFQHTVNGTPRRHGATTGWHQRAAKV
jgi:hypothetical protein